MPAGPAGIYAPAPFGLPTAPLNYQQRFGAVMMREEQEAHSATATSQTAAPAAPTHMMTPQQLAMGALNATAPLIVTKVGTGSGTTSNGALARQRAASPPKATGDEA